jgi:hypothetical protein
LAVLDHYDDEAREGPADAVRATSALRRRIIEAGKRASRESAQPTELVGRAEIVQEITNWLATSGDIARALVLSGEAGIGKSRLLSEAVRIASVRGIRVVEYRPSANGEGRPLAGLLDLLPQLLALPGAVGCNPESYTRLTDLTAGTGAGNTLPENTTDSAVRFATLRRSVRDLVEALLAEIELLVSIDDVHALDRPTLEILLDATRCSGHRFGVIAAMRLGGSGTTLLESRADVRLIRIPNLDAQSARRIVSQNMSSELAVQRAQLVDWAVDLAGGNAFFLVELSTHCNGDRPGESLPPSLQIAIERKLDSLSPAAQLLVQACAVLAQNATLARLETMLAFPPHIMAEALSELEGVGLVTFKENHVACRHDLIAEQVARGLGTTLGRYLHRRCALALDRDLEASPGASLAWDCARHWDAAGDDSRALDLTTLIVDRLLSLGLPQEAADLCVRAERYCGTPAQNADRLLRLSRAHHLLHDWAGVVRALEQRFQLRPHRPEGHSRYSDDDIALFEARWWRDYDGKSLQQALRRVRDVRAPTLHRLRMAVPALVIADNRQQQRSADRLAQLVESIHANTSQERLEKNRARVVYHSSFGDLDLAVESAQQVVCAERNAAHGATLARALRWLSTPLKLADDVDGAITALRESYDVARHLELRQEMFEAALYLQDVGIDSENPGIAREWGEIATRLAASLPPMDGLRQANCAYLHARGHAMDGNYVQAQQLLEVAGIPNGSSQWTRSQQSLVALQVLVCSRLDGEGPPRALVDRLRRLYLRTRRYGANDFELGVLLASLIEAGNAVDARRLLTEYLQIRRTRMKPHSLLEEARRALL